MNKKCKKSEAEMDKLYSTTVYTVREGLADFVLA